MKKLGLLSVTGLTMLLGLVNVNTAKRAEAPKAQTLEVKDVLVKGATEGEGRVVRRAAAPATEYGMSDTFLQVTAPDAEGNVDVRFVAGIDSYAYTEAKFGVEMFAGTQYKGSIEKAVTTAYAAMEIDGEVKTASEVFGEGYNYLIAYTMKDMPKDSWGNGFRATVGLKAEGDEEFTEQETQEVKVVKSAILADNHLVFTWQPYNDSWGTLRWENDFVASQVDSTLDPNMDNYGGAINAALQAKVVATITYEDGTTYSSSGTHSVGDAFNSKALNMQFVGAHTQTEKYTYDVTITYDGAEGDVVVKGTHKFTSLGTVENVVVTENNGDFIITFDEVKNASSYTYRIFNDSYTSKEIEVKSGDVLSTTVLNQGTYSLEVKALSNFYVPSSKVYADALVIENAITLVDGTDKFVYDIQHSGNAWEGIFRFKPVDATDAITVDNALGDLEVKKGNSDVQFDFISYNVNGVSATKAMPYYDANTGYYTVGYNMHQSPTANDIYSMYFVVATDAGTYYTINIVFMIDDNRFATGATVGAMYGDLLSKDVAALDPTQYSVDNWTLIESLRDNAIASLATASADAAKGIYEAAIAEIKAIKKQVKISDAINFFDVEAWHKGGDWEYIIRFKPKSDAQAITGDNRVSEFVGTRPNGQTFKASYINRTVGDVKINHNYPYYDAATGYYGFALSFGTFSLGASTHIYFEVQTDAGELYYFDFYITVTTNDPAPATVEFARAKYVNTPENFGLVESVYAPETWATIEELYAGFAADLAAGADLTKLQEYIDTATAIEMDGIVAIDPSIKKTWTVTTDDTQPGATSGALTDNNYGNGWQLSNNASGRYYLITLDQAYDLVAIYVKWEGANAAAYTIEVSEDGVDFREAGSFSTSPVLAGREDKFALSGATNVRYVRILMTVPGSNYGYQAREIDLFISK